MQRHFTREGLRALTFFPVENFMSDSLALLALPVREANRQIVGGLLKPGYSLEYLDIGEYLVRDNGEVNLPIFSSQTALQDPTWIFRGEATVTYKRLDLQQALGHLGLNFRVGPTYTTDELVSRVGQALDIHFEPNEFIRETKSLTQLWDRYLLRAAADSPRWQGEVSVLVYR